MSLLSKIASLLCALADLIRSVRVRIAKVKVEEAVEETKATGDQRHVENAIGTGGKPSTIKHVGMLTRDRKKRR